MTNLINDPSEKNKKRLLPRMSILIPAALVLGLAYVFYFNPAFLPDNLLKNPTSNNPISNITVQNETAQPLNGGGS